MCSQQVDAVESVISEGVVKPEDVFDGRTTIRVEPSPVANSNDPITGWDIALGFTWQDSDPDSIGVTVKLRGSLGVALLDEKTLDHFKGKNLLVKIDEDVSTFSSSGSRQVSSMFRMPIDYVRRMVDSADVRVRAVHFSTNRDGLFSATVDCLGLCSAKQRFSKGLDEIEKNR